jgi:hypothetical protein
MTGVNSLLGHSIFEEMRNDYIAIHTGETPHKFLGTINSKEESTVPVPSHSIKILNSKSKPRTFKKQVLGCDYFIIDLSNTEDFEEVEYILKLMRSEEAGKEQIVVVISNVMTWMNTPMKLMKHFPKQVPEDSDVEEMNTVREDESETEDDPLNPANKVLYFTDADY